MASNMNKKDKRKIRFYYYEDPETHEYITKLPHWKKSTFVREATKTKMKKELKSYPQVGVVDKSE